MFDGFVRVCAATPPLKVADAQGNAREIARLVKDAAAKGAHLCAFPELSITGYTAGDLFLSDVLIAGALQGLEIVRDATRGSDMVAVVGLPVADGNRTYNCAAVLQNGRVLGVVPKTHLPNYAEFSELRYFAPGFPELRTLRLLGEDVPFSRNLLFRAREMPEFSFAVEICEDLWAPNPTGIAHVLAGAAILVNPSASDALAGKREKRRRMVQTQSGRLCAGYVYAGAGADESTQDMVFAGHSMIYECGARLAETGRFFEGLLFADMDARHAVLERRARNGFREDAEPHHAVPFSAELREIPLMRAYDPAPFVPSDIDVLSERAEEVLSIQARGLAKRLRHTGARRAVLGVSGGLDSTLALLVCARALEMLGLSPEALLAITMPCFGTTERTRSNAEVLARGVGAEFREIDISRAVERHMLDIGLPESDRSAAYENAQARERTQVLMDVANMVGGLVVGTGDLSELALGWATYNGDHMSMYSVNASVPKTLIRHLIAHEAGHTESEPLRGALADVLDTPISPELLPPEGGGIAQRTEDLVGPYRLHDFFLYHMLRRRADPGKILRLALRAFDGEFDADTVRKWLDVFVRRFFSQQFKRSAMPDGPKVGSVSLSPRGDWRMPSDASAELWQSSEK